MDNTERDSNGLQLPKEAKNSKQGPERSKRKRDGYTQFHSGLAQLYPRKSRRTLELLEKEKPLEYCTQTSKVGSRMIQGMAEDLDRILFTIANGNAPTAKAIVACLLKKRPFLKTTTDSSAKHKPTTTADQAISQGVVNFLRLHNSAGRRPTHHQDAVDAVLRAACSAAVEQPPQTIVNLNNDNNPPPPSPTFPLIASRLGISQAKLAPYQQQAGQRFVPKIRKTRADCYRADAIECVLSFCHSNESSWAPVVMNPDNPPKYALRQVTHPITGLPEHHTIRIWHVPTMKERYSLFLQSKAYREFVGATQGKTIGKTVFQSSLCPCVLNHHPKGKDREGTSKPTAVTDNTAILLDPGEEMEMEPLA